MQTETKSSQFASKMIQQTNYSALSSLPKQYIKQVSAEGEIFLQAPTRCARIWKEFRKQDFTHVQIPYNLGIQIYKTCQEDIQRLLKINSGREFFELFDQDNDGFLNEDEQILVFSVIKEKMQQVANLLLQIQQYMAFKQLMLAIRQLEQNICEYQNCLRQKIYKNEVHIYEQIGQEKLDDFYEKYYELFQQFEDHKSQRMYSEIHNSSQQQIQKQNDEMDALAEKLSKNTEFLKVKPKRKLKDLQTQEKLVSLDERVEEALDFRKELKNMEKAEQQRVQSEQQKRIDNQKEAMVRKHRKQMDQLKVKLEEQEHKLIIQLNKEYNVLLKQIGLHSNEIERIQSSSTQSALKKGREEGELKRMKERARIQNYIIGETKNVMNRSFQASGEETKSQNQSPRSPQNATRGERGPVELRQIIAKQNYTQFYIKKKYGADLPVNYKAEPYRVVGDNHERIEKILSVKKKSPHDILPSLTELYDQKLQQIHITGTQKSETELNQDKQLRKQFISEKLQR